MSIKMNTQSELVHRTTILGDQAHDGGRARILETFDNIHEDRETGKLVIDFGQGSINSIYFEQRVKTTQRELDTWDDQRHGANGNHLAVRGAMRVLDGS